jgi:probable phosphomutase (TIGR03848 family)
MTTFLLIRHGLCDPVGKAIAGRTLGVHLNVPGRAQAEALAARLSSLPISAIYSSPLERALETAEPLARRLHLRVSSLAGLNEVDFGDWTGLTLAALAEITEWREFNTRRSTTRIPNGEIISEVVARVSEELDRLRRQHESELVAVVSHGDVLRGLLSHVLGMPLDLLHRLEVEPASVSALSYAGGAPRLLLMNSTEGWPPDVSTPGIAVRA